MDLSIVIPRIYPGARFRLSSSVPPHSIVEWREAYPIPDQQTLYSEWQKYLAEQQVKTDEISNVQAKGEEYQMLLNGEVFDIFLLKKP